MLRRLNEWLALPVTVVVALALALAGAVAVHRATPSSRLHHHVIWAVS
jgi:hypothetical protein